MSETVNIKRRAKRLPVGSRRHVAYRIRTDLYNRIKDAAIASDTSISEQMERIVEHHFLFDPVTDAYRKGVSAGFMLAEGGVVPMGTEESVQSLLAGSPV